MEVKSTGKNSFLVSTKNADIALERQEGKFDTILSTTAVEKRPKTGEIIFDGPGEYEIKNAMIDGIEMSSESTAYAIVVDALHFLFLPELTGSLDDAQLEKIGRVDVVLMPLRGEKAEITIKVITQLEAKAVIVFDYTQEQLAILSTEFGKKPETVEKYKINAKELSLDSQEIVVFAS